MNATPVVDALDVDGLITPLRHAGPATDREAVVFLHGSPGSSEDFVDLLAATGSRFRTVAWDAPGFGEADKPRQFRHTLAGHAAFLDQALDALGIDFAHLVLHGMAGPSGLHWAADHPDRVASVSLFNTGVHLGHRWHGLASAWRTALLGELAMLTLTAGAFERWLRHHTPAPLPPTVVSRMYRQFDGRSRRAVRDLYRSVGDLEAESRRVVGALRPYDLPALVVWGCHDPLSPIEDAERQLEAFPSARIELLAGAGHWPFIDAPLTVGDRLGAFLSDVTEHARAGEAHGGDGRDLVAPPSAALRGAVRSKSATTG